MRILLVTPLFPSPNNLMVGKDRYALASNLEKRGHEVAVVTFGKKIASIQNEVYGVSSIVLPKIQYPIPNMFELFRIISKVGGDFDIHHYYQQEYPTILPSFLFKNSVKVLTVDNFPGVDWTYGKSLIDAFARLESLTIGRRAMRNFDGIIFLSTASMETAVHLVPAVKSKKTAWIPHGLDTETIKPDENIAQETREELGVKGFTVVFVGRLVSVKGISYLAKAIRQLDKEGFDGHFIIVGSGPERAALETLKLAHSTVHLLGYQENPIKYIQASEALVLPSLSEGCPNVVLEAFACGKPVIASSVGAIPDLVQHERNGLIVNSGDVAALVDAIRFLAEHLQQTYQMGKHAREYAEQELNWTVIVERILSFYSDLMN